MLIDAVDLGIDLCKELKSSIIMLTAFVETDPQKRSLQWLWTSKDEVPVDLNIMNLL